jgi:hypothetical protein
VKGHQDKPREEFYIWERLNSDCEKDAGVFCEWCVYQRRPNHCITFPEESWAIWKGATKIATNLLEEIYNLVHAPAAKQVWVDSGWVDENMEHMVDQEDLSQSAAALTIHHRLWVMKHKHGMCGVNQYMT